ncbi:TraB/GumN family protein [Mangrovimonas spongiae]|uniref:TraB/GumN family protein n=1 Tax=Mangrovimonas spongiae TaxID=2494697 RepID=A0A3R9MCF7_9FLAO|nr:TraB/GumN family protein [Mangrovimonas spongiae]RSK38726.1 TraB/GumN family protein [Mangrovimonas spongiae]
MKLVISFCVFFTLSYFALGQNTILWKVSDTINKKTSYVVGTFHQFGNSFVDNIPELKKVLLRSELAIFESTANPQDTRNMIAQRDRSLDIENYLKKRDLKKLKQISVNWKVDLYKLHPIELSWKLQQEFQKIKCKTVKPTDKWDHFDNYLIHIAKQNKIECLGLETDSMQLNFIAKEHNFPSWKDEKKTIHLFIKKLSRNKLEKGDCFFTEKYRNFNLDYKLTEDCPDNILIKQRNQNWMKVLPNFLKNKNCFVALGYLHLTRNCGVLSRLQALGFVVTPVEL